MCYQLKIKTEINRVEIKMSTVESKQCEVNPYSELLPPSSLEDIWQFFELHEHDAHQGLQGYSECAEELADKLERLVSPTNEDPRKIIRLPLDFYNGYTTSRLRNKVPEGGSRALMELTYSLTKAEIVGDKRKTDDTGSRTTDFIFLHGVYDNRLLEFAEVYTIDPEEGLTVEWTVRLDEIRESSEHDWQRATRAEAQELVDTTLDGISSLPGLPKAA